MAVFGNVGDFPDGSIRNRWIFAVAVPKSGECYCEKIFLAVDGGGGVDCGGGNFYDVYDVGGNTPSTVYDGPPPHRGGIGRDDERNKIGKFVVEIYYIPVYHCRIR